MEEIAQLKAKEEKRKLESEVMTIIDGLIRDQRRIGQY